MPSNEKPNTIEQEDKLVQTNSQKGSNEKLNVFEQEAKRVRMKNRPRSLKVWNELEQDSETRLKVSTDSVN